MREWNYTTNLHQPGGMQDRDLLAAAAIACQAQVWDRCINTSERTKSFVSWQQRYPMPFKDEVVTRAIRSMRCCFWCWPSSTSPASGCCCRPSSSRWRWSWFMSAR